MWSSLKYVGLLESCCNQAPRGYESCSPPSFMVEGALFQGSNAANHCRISRSEPALAQRATARNILSSRPKFPDDETGSVVP